MEEKKGEHHHVRKEIKIKADYFKIASFVLLILLVFSLFTAGFRFEKSVSKNKAAETAIGFINENVLPTGNVAKIDSVEKKGNLYEMEITVGTSQYTIYTTKDASLLFLNGINMKQETTTVEQEEKTSCEDVPKTSKPKVELFVMSMCPYGAVAVNTLAPVYEVLKDVADIKVNFIANQNKDGTFTSLHGAPEVSEDIRQVCIMEKYPRTYFKYLQCIADDYSNAAVVWQDCAKKSSMDVTIIKKCSESQEGIDLLKENIKRANELQIGASPTFLVNEVEYSGARTPEAYKDFICCGAAVELAECEEMLSSTSETSSGSC